MDRESARELYRYVWRTSRSKQITICILTAIVAPLSMVILELQRRIVDDAITRQNFTMLTILAGAYIAVILIRLGFKFALDMVKGAAVETIARDLRLKIARITGSLSKPDKKESSGTTVSMLGAETEDMSGFAGDALSVPLLNLGTVFSVMGYLIWLEPLIAVLAIVVYFPQLVIVPLTQFTINRLGRMRIRLVRRLGRIAAGSERKRTEDGASPEGSVIIDRLYRVRIWIYLRKFFLAELGNFLDSLGPIIVLTVGGYLAITGKTQVSTLIVFISGLQKIAEPWDQTITFYRTVSNTAVMYQMLRDKLAKPSAAKAETLDAKDASGS